MPLFEYHCQSCDNEFELLVRGERQWLADRLTRSPDDAAEQAVRADALTRYSIRDNLFHLTRRTIRLDRRRPIGEHDHGLQ